MGVQVEYVEDLDVCGLYIHDERRVLVKAGLPPMLERSCLAHEAVHAELGHEQQDNWCRELKQERIASALAARRLIDYNQLVALKAAGLDEKEICEKLQVARPLLRAYMWLSAPAWHLAA